MNLPHGSNFTNLLQNLWHVIDIMKKKYYSQTKPSGSGGRMCAGVEGSNRRSYLGFSSMKSSFKPTPSIKACRMHVNIVLLAKEVRLWVFTRSTCIFRQVSHCQQPLQASCRSTKHVSGVLHYGPHWRGMSTQTWPQQPNALRNARPSARDWPIVTHSLIKLTCRCNF